MGRGVVQDREKRNLYEMQETRKRRKKEYGEEIGK